MMKKGTREKEEEEEGGHMKGLFLVLLEVFIDHPSGSILG